MNQNLQYPEEAQKQNLTGTVLVSFFVEEDGTPSDVQVLQGIGAGCDEEAVRVVKLLTDWLPGRQKGRPVRVQVQLPISFGVSGNLEVEKPKGSKVIYR
jgi:protein TonB